MTYVLAADRGLGDIMTCRSEPEPEFAEGVMEILRV